MERRALDSRDTLLVQVQTSPPPPHMQALDETLRINTTLFSAHLQRFENFYEELSLLVALPSFHECFPKSKSMKFDVS